MYHFCHQLSFSTESTYKSSGLQSVLTVFVSRNENEGNIILEVNEKSSLKRLSLDLIF